MWEKNSYIYGICTQTHFAIRIINDVYVNDVKKLLSHVYGSNKMMLHTRAPNSNTKIKIYFYVQVDVDACVLISLARSLSFSYTLSMSVTPFDFFVAHLHIGLNESSTEMQMRELESLIHNTIVQNFIYRAAHWNMCDGVFVCMCMVTKQEC